MNLMFFTHNLGAGGAEQFMASHIANLDRRTYDVSVCVLRKPRGTSLEPQFRALDVPIIELGERRRPDPQSLVRLVRVLRERKIDILQSHLGYANLLARLAAPLAGVRAVVTTEQALAVTLGRWMARLDAWTLGWSDGSVFISEGVKQSFLGNGHGGRRRKIRRAPVIPNGVDCEAIARLASDRAGARAALGLAPGELVVGHVGRLSPEKGHVPLVHAFAEVHRALPGTRLVLVGAGPEEPRIRALVAELGLGGAVLMAGFRSDVLTLLGAFDLFVMPSLEEGLGVAALEAMAAGIPVVATRAGGLAEVVEDRKSGLLVAPGDAPGLAAAMLELLRDRALADRFVAQARAAVAARYSIQASVAAYDRLYRECLSAP